jgi:hypothetical protein
VQLSARYPLFGALQVASFLGLKKRLQPNKSLCGLIEAHAPSRPTEELDAPRSLLTALSDFGDEEDR